jgi:hypothetical protein
MKDPKLHATTRSGYYPETAADLNPVIDKSMSSKQVTANLKAGSFGCADDDLVQRKQCCSGEVSRRHLRDSGRQEWYWLVRSGAGWRSTH